MDLATNHRCNKQSYLASPLTISLLWYLLLLAVIGCSTETSPPVVSNKPSETSESLVQVDLNSRRPAMMLSEYNLFSDLKNQVPSKGVIPYSLAASHFVDYAVSHHYLYLPPGTQAEYHEHDVFSFPVGTILIQSLGFLNDLRDPQQGERLVETRLLIHQHNGWLAVAYLWNEVGTDARRAVIGGKTDILWTHYDGSARSSTYLTPDMNQCKRCHKKQDAVTPLGLRARNLNHSSNEGESTQLKRWIDEGLLVGAPNEKAWPHSIDWRYPSTGSTETRARSWLDINCAHCHNPDGQASVSGLDLSLHQQMSVRFGVYKPPVAAGRGSSGYKFSINPGSPESSFLLHRIRSTDPGAMMPTVGRSLVDDEGAALVEQWIREMPADSQLAERAMNPVSAYREALTGGDAARGKQLFYSTAKCSSCHQAKPEDRAHVGPSLVGVATRNKRDYMLESIVAPSAKIVEKYVVTIAETDDGKIHSGIIVTEDANELVLRMADATEVKLTQSSIEERSVSKVSLMPSMANILSTQDVADLIEFLSTLTEEQATRSK